jgi:CRP-like cAMP-binding protein
MPLVRNPLNRTLPRDYIWAAKRLAGRFYVLTNGEHLGPIGVNGIVDRAFDGAGRADAGKMYLPGLGAGGVHWQNDLGHLSSPGVTEAERAATMMAIEETRCVALDAILLHEIQQQDAKTLTGEVYRFLSQLFSVRLVAADQELAVLRKELKSVM